MSFTTISYMHWLRSSLIVSKILLLFGFCTSFVLSCSPGNNGGNVISISLTLSHVWRVNMAGWNANPGNNVIVFNSGFQPDYNEVFLLFNPPGVYEFHAFENFYRTSVIEIPSNNLNVGSTFKIGNSTNGDNQRFSIECNSCNLQNNTENWTQYHTSCLIKNIKSGFCMNGTDASTDLSQVDCSAAPTWDLYGRILPDIKISSNCPVNSPVSSEPSNSTPETAADASTIKLSIGEILGIIFGSITATTLVALVIGYFFIRRRNRYSEGKDPINVQFYNGR